MERLNVAIIGATGLVGTKIVEILANTTIEIENIYFFSSFVDAGQKIEFRNKTYYSKEASKKRLQKLDLDVVFLAAGGDVSYHYAEFLINRGIYVIDNSSYFRMKNHSLLIIPEVNGELLTKKNYLISNPNCSTIQSLLPIKAIADCVDIEKIIYSTYQAVSGSGVNGIKSLEGELSHYKYPIKNNLIPQIDTFIDDDYTKEEVKMINETKKILNNFLLDISATCVRVPISNCHAVDITLELKRNVSVEKIKKLLNKFEGIKVVDDPSEEMYPMPIIADEQDDVLVGRIRKSYVFDNGVRLFVVADNLRKGAALNAVQILEKMVERGIFNV